jgi:hypothetical protein
MAVTTIGRTTATSQGVAIRGEFRVRSVPTADGDKIVRLAGPDDEGPYSLANQLLGSGLAERLGLYQPRRWIVEIPPRIETVAGWTGRLRHRLGAGVDYDPAFSVELDNPVVVADSRARASGESVIATLVLLEWLRMGDHVDHNFVFKDAQMIPIDFASAPQPDAWQSAAASPSTGEDSGGLRAELHRVDETESKAVRARFDRIDEVALRRILNRIPDEMTDGHSTNVVSVLMNRKQEVRNAYWP